MNDASARTLFSVLCLLAAVAIAVGGVLEVLRQKRGESLLRPTQFRLRVFSAIVWIILLGALAYAVAFLWPHDKVSASKFLAIVSGSLSLLVIAIFLLAFDVWQIGKQRRATEHLFHQQLEAMAQGEIEKMQAQKSAPESSSPGSGEA